MKLVYCKLSHGNFGDDFNLWLWPRLVPGLLNDQDGEKVFVGIGSLLNDLLRSRAPQAKKFIIFGSGVGYGTHHLGNLPSLDILKILFLRGPLSAQALNVPQSLVISDAAYCIRLLNLPTLPKKFRFSLMPHWCQARLNSHAWQAVCHFCGVHYIDPRWPVEKVLHDINATHTLISGALHGAIVADALRVPWIPVPPASDPHLGFKWLDWCLSINHPFNPRNLIEVEQTGWRKIIQTKYINLASRQLKSLLNTKPSLSSHDIIENLTQRLQEKIKQLKEKYT